MGRFPGAELGFQEQLALHSYEGGPPLNRTEAHVQQFARRFFELVGARLEPTKSGWRVELTREQLNFVENLPSWGTWGYEPPDGGLTTFYFTFDDDEVIDDERVELLGRGSFRLQQLCETALRYGALGRVFIRSRRLSSAGYRPHIVFHFLVSYVGHDVRERTASVVVDLVSGDAFPCPPLSGESLQSTSAGGPVQPARFSVGEAHEQAVDFLCSIIADEDATWYREKWDWIEDELDRLYAYLHLASDEHPSDVSLAPLREARLTELREMSRPRVELRAAAATLLYAPDDTFS